MVTRRDGEVILISLIVHGKPVPQGSKKWVGRLVDDNAKTLKPWRAQMAEELRSLEVDPILVPVEVDLQFYFQRPKHHYGTGRNAAHLKDSAPLYHSSYPDVDKLARSVLDALTESAVIRDDGQVCVLTVTKKYAPTPGVWIKLRPA